MGGVYAPSLAPSAAVWVQPLFFPRYALHRCAEDWSASAWRHRLPVLRGAGGTPRLRLLVGGRQIQANLGDFLALSAEYANGANRATFSIWNAPFDILADPALCLDEVDSAPFACDLGNQAYAEWPAGVFYFELPGASPAKTLRFPGWPPFDADLPAGASWSRTFILTAPPQT